MPSSYVEHLVKLLDAPYERNAAREALLVKAGVEFDMIDSTGTNAEVLARIILHRALKGDAKAIEDIADRVDKAGDNVVKAILSAEQRNEMLMRLKDRGVI